MKKTFLILSLCLLSACASFHVEEAEKRIEAECPSEIKGQMAKRSRCERDIVLEEFSNHQILPTIISSYKEVIRIGELYDRGEMSKVRYLELESDIKAELEASIASFNSRSHTQAWKDVDQSMQEYARQQAANRPRMTNCIAGPYSTSCTTY